MRLAAVIVVYNPDIDFLNRNILSLIGQVDHLLLYQNSFLTGEDLSNKYENLSLLGNGENVGIAAALNRAVEWAEINLFTHLLTLDQDSNFNGNDLIRFRSLIEHEKMPDIGIYCPNIDNRGKLLVEKEQSVMEVRDSITSGSIFPLETFKVCGGFEENLFIDAVDYEYCYRIFINSNLKTVVYPDIILKHEVGYPTRIRFGFTTDNYSAFRTYFIVRNQLIIWRRYPKLFQPSYKITLVKIHIIFRFIKIILGEEDKINKLKSIVRGIYHGLKNK
ncbi:MAG: hypothetical protein EOO42_00190 [Flavobacteriales bacterium]|nr:MAG: hypothetical protein EOO42_00190 [Flavobacteriales bacterium]